MHPCASMGVHLYASMCIVVYGCVSGRMVVYQGAWLCIRAHVCVHGVRSKEIEGLLVYCCLQRRPESPVNLPRSVHPFV